MYPPGCGRFISGLLWIASEDGPWGGGYSSSTCISRALPSAPHCKTLCKEARQTGPSDFLLRGREIVFYPQKFDEMVLDVVYAISCAPVSVARLSHAAGVDEIFFARLDANVLGRLTPDAFVANKDHWHVCVAEKTDGGALIGETRDRIEIIEHIAPLPGRIERGVHDRKIMHPPL
jgi:hypothetical protein